MLMPKQRQNERLLFRRHSGLLWQFINSFLVLFLLIAPDLLAHGGEDHGEASGTVMTTSGRNTVSAQSDNFDIVAEFGSLEASKPFGLDLYLSDYETNAPIANATIEVNISGHDESRVQAKAESDPGLYSVTLSFPASGHYDLLFDISTSDKADIIEIKGISVGKEVPDQTKSESRTFLTFTAAGIGLILLVAAVWYIFGRKKNRNLQQAVRAILIATTLTSSSIFAHGGEDHGDAEGSALTSATPGYMSKASQFLLGVRTVFAKTQTATKQITVLGRVVAPPTSQVQIYAPQSGLLVASRDVPYPSQGDWVKKGQAIAILQVLDQFVIRAPISGIVSAIHAVPGEQVHPAHELFTIYDYTKVWVEANLFENDLIHLEPKPPASLLVDIAPGETFPIRFVNFESVVDPATRTLKAIYEVNNPKMLLRPGMVVNVNIESEKRLDALVVPSNSIMDWEGQKVIFVHEQPEIFEMRPVKILGYYGDVVAVEGLVAVGDRVVTTGAYELLNIPHRAAEGGFK